VLAATTYRLLPLADRRGRFSVKELLSVWQFAGGVFGVTLLAFFLAQIDKIILSKILSLSEYGYYALAATVAASLQLIVGPITQAFFPRFCELKERENNGELASAFHKSAQLVSVVAGSAAIIMIFFSDFILILWTKDLELSRNVAHLLQLLVIGGFLNVLMWVPYQIQLAHGWTSLGAMINLFAVLAIVPAIAWATPKYGAEGAAWVWVTLNSGYLLIGAHFMHRRILINEKWKWYIRDLLLPFFSGVIALLIIQYLLPSSESLFKEVLRLIASYIFVLITTVVAASRIRQELLTFLATKLRILAQK
jgi:O-antigen/teichoic acid export membrane protein